MSLFVSTSLQLVGDTVINQAVWSNVDNLAAVSAFTVDDHDKEINQVLFANNEGELLQGAEIQHEFEATVLAWHPTERVLCVGWGDGMISSWIIDGKSRPISVFTNTSQHHSTITVLQWNPSGKRLVTGDKRGVVCVWSADSRGVLAPMRQYKRKGEITQLVFCVLSSKLDLGSKASSSGAVASSSAPSNNSNEGGVKVSQFTPSFFFSTDRGTLCYADDMGHCTDIHSLSSSIDILLFYPASSYLLLITRSLLLITYHISGE
eukprot:gene40644-49554_t